MQIEVQRDWDLSKKQKAPLGHGGWLNSSDIVATLQARAPMLSFDRGGRQNLWHPRQDEFMGVRYWHKHVCSMDRGMSPKWPQWSIKEELIEVDRDYAMLHDDLPVFDTVEGKSGVFFEGQKAYIMGTQMDDIERLGWAELFWRLLRLNIPNIDKEWLGRAFKVGMDWYDQQRISPVTQCMVIGMKKGWIQ